MRIYELDSLRGIAALSVMLGHYTFGYNLLYHHHASSYFEFSLGHYGVELFFIISGFVIYMTLEKVHHRPFDFIISRFSRLYPAYWVAVTLTFLVVYFHPLPDWNISLKEYFLNLTMLQGRINELGIPVNPIDVVYWTLIIELHFYFFMFMIFIGKMKRYLEFIGFFVWIGIALLFKQMDNLVFYQQLIKALFVLSYGNLFFAGILFYNLKFKGNKWYRHVLIIGCLAVEYVLNGMEATMVVTFFFLLFYLFIFGYLKFLSSKPLIFFGTISYSLYLIHANVGFVIIQALYSIGITSYPLIILIPVIVAWTLATSITLLVEQPAMKLIRKNYGKIVKGK